MLRHLFTFMLCAFIMPAAMAVNSSSVKCNSAFVLDDDDDEDKKDNNPIGINRPFVVCRNISKTSAELVLKVRVRNKTDRDITGVVEFELEDMQGNEVAKVNKKAILPAGKSVVVHKTITLKNPHLYSSEPSYRYKLEAEVMNNKGDEISKEKKVKFFVTKGNSKDLKQRAVNKVKINKIKKSPKGRR